GISYLRGKGRCNQTAGPVCTRNVAGTIFYLFDAWDGARVPLLPRIRGPDAVRLLRRVPACRLEAGRPVSPALPASSPPPSSSSIAVIYRTALVSACLAHAAERARTATDHTDRQACVCAARGLEELKLNEATWSRQTPDGPFRWKNYSEKLDTTISTMYRDTQSTDDGSDAGSEWQPNHCACPANIVGQIDCS
ncbi:unnamed protein product, partial [Menidia menidia]